jgi:hypothetical protein
LDRLRKTTKSLSSDSVRTKIRKEHIPNRNVELYRSEWFPRSASNAAAAVLGRLAVPRDQTDPLYQFHVLIYEDEGRLIAPMSL